MIQGEKINRLKIISVVDSIVVILFVIVGFLMMLSGFYFKDAIIGAFSYYIYILASFGSSPYASPDLPFWYYAPFWIMIVSGITMIIYGFKKLIDNILRFKIVNSLKW